MAVHALGPCAEAGDSSVSLYICPWEEWESSHFLVAPRLMLEIVL